MAEYKLSYKASEIDRKLGKVDTLVATVNGISPDENGNVEISVGSNITVDSSLSSTSENPVQNKVVSEKFDTKADTDHTHSDYATIAYVNDTFALKTDESGNVNLNDYYTKTEIDNYVFITTDDIDNICKQTVAGGVSLPNGEEAEF